MSVNEQPISGNGGKRNDGNGGTDIRMETIGISEQSLSHVIPLKTDAIESAQNRRATIRLRIYTLIANI